MGDFSELKLDGRVATPDDPDWDEARQAWNLAADPQPSAVAIVEGPDDVAAVLRFAGASGQRVVGQGTGHGAFPLGSFEDTIVIKTERMRGVEVDGEAKTARVEAGVLALELGEAAHKHRLSSLPGSSPNVGVTGFNLGGGLSFLGRRYGFACNRVRAIELVTADGEQRRVDADNEPDLFWALRGGGGGYAIVTALELELLPVSEAYGGALLVPAEIGADAFRAYRGWAAEIPDEITSSIRFMHLPPIPDVPEILQDRPLIMITAASIGSREEGEKAIAPLREIGEPVMDTFDQVPATGLYTIAMDPEPPVPGIGHHGLIRELPDEAIDAFVGVAGPGSGSPLLLAEFRHAGGALARPAENAGALDKLDAEFILFGIGLPMAPEMAESINERLDLLAETMQPWAAEGGYFNFAERPGALETILPAETCKRLADVKRQWDPDDLIRANHAVSMATA
jgi:FAD binding domain